jgi:hypothetical protein
LAEPTSKHPIEWNQAQLEGRADARILDATDPYEHESSHPGFNEYAISEKRRHGPGHILPPYGQYGGALREMWDAAYALGQLSMLASISQEPHD